MIRSSAALRPSLWVRAVAVLGLLWNAFGIVQFVGSVSATEAQLLLQGMTAEQAQIYANLPIWMDAAFAIGVFGGFLGSALLVLGLPSARPVFAVSLAAYVVLYVGDITEGVFAAFGAGQVAILTTVVAIAAGLLWVSHRAGRRGDDQGSTIGAAATAAS